MSTISAVDNIENKHSLYHGEDCVKDCFSLRELAANVINFEKKKMLPLTKKELKFHEDSTICDICKKKFTQKLAKDKTYRNVRDNCHFIRRYRGAAHSICNLRFS